MNWEAIWAALDEWTADLHAKMGYCTKCGAREDHHPTWEQQQAKIQELARAALAREEED